MSGKIHIFQSLRDRCRAAAINLCQRGGGLVFQSQQYKSIFEYKKIFLEATRGLSGESGKNYLLMTTFTCGALTFLSLEGHTFGHI